MVSLPKLMVAPNGARRTKADHPALPMTLHEITATAIDCAAAGADGLHLHLRNTEGQHILDSGLYREALAELRMAVPDMVFQITTEAAGHYFASHQRVVALKSGAKSVSVALREMVQGTEDAVARTFYMECEEQGIAIQHIMYCPADFALLPRLLSIKTLHDPALQLLFVLGCYSDNQQGMPKDLTPFIERIANMGLNPDWAVCAFGKTETACLMAASRLGGKLRVGFENSFSNDDGGIAQNNAERVRKIKYALSASRMKIS